MTTNYERIKNMTIEEMAKEKDLIGQKFGKVTVIKIDHKDKKGEIYWECLCDCGNLTIIRNSNLLNGHTKNCGCLWKKHKQSYSRLYRKFCGMKQRCYNPNSKSYKNYGGRGIIICDEWLSNFMNFHNWAVNNGYKEGLTIERINNNGNYEPNNCKWITKSEQQDNTRNCKFIEYKGEVHNISQWAKKLNINRNTLASKLHKGLSLKSIIEQAESEE